jgi:predicted alpha/beta hydrolase
LNAARSKPLHVMTETISFTAADQHSFDATFYPVADAAAPVLIFLSALGTPAKVYRHLGREMSLHGVQLCTPDWRGIGSSSIRATRVSDFGYRHLVELDIAAAIAGVSQRFPQSPLWLGGHSLGGQLSLLAAAANPKLVSGVVLIASGTVHLPCYATRTRLAVLSLACLSRPVGLVLGYFPGARIGFGGREAAGLMRDWSHVALTGEYRPRGSQLDYERLMLELKIPILALSFAADSWSPARATQGLLKKLPEKSVAHRHWSAADTAGVALDHYNWLKQPNLVAPAVARFITQSA